MKVKILGKVLAIAGGLAAITAVCVSIYLNPPSTARAHALDRERLQSLQQIDLAVRAYYRNYRVLPDHLDAIDNKNGLAAHSNWKDPVTHLAYEYSVTGKTTYRLCGDFAADSDNEEPPYIVAFRKHHKGRDCFQQDMHTE